MNAPFLHDWEQKRYNAQSSGNVESQEFLPVSKQLSAIKSQLKTDILAETLPSVASCFRRLEFLLFELSRVCFLTSVSVVISSKRLGSYRN